MWGCAYPAGLQAPSAPSMLLLQMAATEAAHAKSDEAKQDNRIYVVLVRKFLILQSPGR